MDSTVAASALCILDLGVDSDSIFAITSNEASLSNWLSLELIGAVQQLSINFARFAGLSRKM